MGFSLRTIADSVRFSEAVSLNALEQTVPRFVAEAVVSDLGVEEQRVRKLTAVVTLLFCVAMGLFTNMALEQVLIKMVKGLCYIWPDENYQTRIIRDAIPEFQMTAPEQLSRLYQRLLRNLLKQVKIG